jgi:hypothetical protein
MNPPSGLVFFDGTSGKLAVASPISHGLSLIEPARASVSLVSQHWVGIGTAMPSAPLHVVGNFAVQGADAVDLHASRMSLGIDSVATGPASTAMGFRTTASGTNSTSMGLFTTASGTASTAMGQSTSASGQAATAMGRFTSGQGDYSLAAGYRALAGHNGTFVWADLTETDFASTASNQFLIRARGGVGIGATAPGGALHIVSPAREPPTGLPPAQNGLVLGLQSTTGYKWIQSYGGPLILNARGNFVGIAKTNPSSALDVNGTVTATAFNPPSDRNLKENFSEVNPREVLDKVAELPIARWNFKSDPGAPHLGPMAQDFHAAFGLGTDDKHIATVDADGVALAAIQALNQKVEEQRQELRRKQADITELRRDLAELERLVHRMARQPIDWKGEPR